MSTILINYENYCAVFFLSSVSFLALLFNCPLDSLTCNTKVRVPLEFEQVNLETLHERICESL